jgi:hypothetical protein
MGEETWLTTVEAAEVTGYHYDYLRKLAHANWVKPENERVIKVRRLSGGNYLLYLPSLEAYIEEHGKGPYKKLPDTP